MAGNRTLKLSILADVDDLKKKLNQGSDQVEGFGGKLDGWAGKAKLAFAAAGAAAAAYAGKLAIEGVKAAIEDEAAQLRLSNALKNVTNATDAQIKSAESYILKTSLATGVSDDQLRPALERLTRSTKDIGEAQKLTNLALDIAAAKNIDVTTAANALAKANDGQTGALKKLGITLGDNATNLQEYNKLQKALEKAQLEANFALSEYGPKSKEYVKASEKVQEITQKANDVAMQGIDVFGELGKEFSGASAQAAETFQGKMARLNVALAEGKETIGSFILDAITPMVTFVVDKVVPAIQSFVEKMSGSGGLSGAFSGITKAIKDNSESFKALFDFLKTYVIPFLTGVLKLAIKGIADGITLTVNAIGALIDGFRTLISLGSKVGNFISGLNPFGGGRATGGPVSMGKTYLVGEKGPELFSPSSNGYITPNKSIASAPSQIINITVNGAVDAVSTARQIATILKNEANNSGSFTNLGVSAFA